MRTFSESPLTEWTDVRASANAEPRIFDTSLLFDHDPVADRYRDDDLARRRRRADAALDELAAKLDVFRAVLDEDLVERW